MRPRIMLALSIVALCFATSTSAQLRPATRWALGLGFSHLASTTGSSSSGIGFGVLGIYAPMITSHLGLEIEGRALLAGGSEAEPSCLPIPGAVCGSRTLVPSEVVGVDARLSFVPDPRLRLSAGPAVAWAPNAVGPNSDPAFGGAAGLSLSPFDRNGRGLTLELRGTRFVSSLTEVEWVLGTALSYRF